MLRAGRDARDLWLASVTWCNKHLTDGYFPPEALPTLAGMAWGNDSKLLANCQELAKRLLDVCLWEFDGQQYKVHDFLEYNPTKDQVETTREARKAAGSAGGHAKASKTPSKTVAKSWQKSAPTPTPNPYLTTTAEAQATEDAFIAAGLTDFSNHVHLIGSQEVSQAIQERLANLYCRGAFEWWKLAIEVAASANVLRWNYVRAVIDGCLISGLPPGSKPPGRAGNGSGRNGTGKPNPGLVAAQRMMEKALREEQEAQANGN